MEEKHVLVSFGSTHQDAVKKCITPLREKLEEKLGEEVIQAFNSHRVRKILSERDIFVPSLKDRLEMLSKDGVQKLHVHVTHLLGGIEYHKIIRDLNSFRHQMSFKLSKPLINSTEDQENLLKALWECYGDEKSTLLLMGHGTAHASNSVYAAMTHLAHHRGLYNIHVAALEGYPDLEDILDDLSKDKPILLAPLLFFPGEHAKEDMVYGEESWYRRLKAKGYDVSYVIKGIGELEKVQELYLSKWK